MKKSVPTLLTLFILLHSHLSDCDRTPFSLADIFSRQKRSQRTTTHHTFHRQNGPQPEPPLDLLKLLLGGSGLGHKIITDDAPFPVPLEEESSPDLSPPILRITRPIGPFLREPELPDHFPFAPPVVKILKIDQEGPVDEEEDDSPLSSPVPSSDSLRAMLGALIGSALNSAQQPIAIHRDPYPTIFGFQRIARIPSSGIDLDEEESPLEAALKQHLSAVSQVTNESEEEEPEEEQENRPTFLRIRIRARPQPEPTLIPIAPPAPIPIPIAVPSIVNQHHSMIVHHAADATPTAKSVRVRSVSAGPGAHAHIVTESTATPIKTETHVIRNHKSVQVHRKRIHRINKKHHVIIHKHRPKSTLKVKRVVVTLPFAQAPPPQPQPQYIWRQQLPPQPAMTGIPFYTYPAYQQVFPQPAFARAVQTTIAEAPQPADEHHMDKTTITTSGNFAQLGSVLATIESDLQKINAKPAHR
jgi:hypothetical protein